MVNTSATRREPAMCIIPAATYVNPNAAMGDTLGTQEVDPTMSPQQAAMQLRDQMIRQVKAMVKTSLLKKQREMASAAATADPCVLTEGSVQDDLDHMGVDLQGAMKAFKGSPLDDVPTGGAGFPADAIIQWDLMEPEMRIRDYKIPAATYLKNTYEANCSRTDVDPGWSDPDCMFEERPANCSQDRVWGDFLDEIPDDREIYILLQRRAGNQLSFGW